MAKRIATPREVRLVSFVIPAWNEAALLGHTLESIRAAAAALNLAHEVVVADDSSTDETAEIARQAGARVISVHHRQISATRNSGARSAGGDMLIFVDADTLVTREVVGAAVRAIRDGAVGGGCAVQFDGRIPRYACEECWLSWALRKKGRFVLLREHVETSSRKLRTFSGWEILRILFWITIRGLPTSRDAKGMDLWYGPRRVDPGQDGSC